MHTYTQMSRIYIFSFAYERYLGLSNKNQNEHHNEGYNCTGGEDDEHGVLEGQSLKQ